MYRSSSEWAKKAWEPAEWFRLCWDPMEWMRLGADCMSMGVWAGQRLYGQKAEAEELERLKKRFQDEIAEIDKRIAELKKDDTKH
jgi:hypothetical protein